MRKKLTGIIAAVVVASVAAFLVIYQAYSQPSSSEQIEVQVPKAIQSTEESKGADSAAEAVKEFESPEGKLVFTLKTDKTEYTKKEQAVLTLTLRAEGKAVKIEYNADSLFTINVYNNKHELIGQLGAGEFKMPKLVPMQVRILEEGEELTRNIAWNFKVREADTNELIDLEAGEYTLIANASLKLISGVSSGFLQSNPVSITMLS